MTFGGSGPVFCSGRHGSLITIRGVSESVSWKGLIAVIETHDSLRQGFTAVDLFSAAIAKV